MNDNITPHNAKEYDSKIVNTIPYYNEFHKQIIDIVRLLKPEDIKWMDLGCGTGGLAEEVLKERSGVTFTMLDPSEQMLNCARTKLESRVTEYICAVTTDIDFEDTYDVITAVQSHHYMKENERKLATKKVYKALKKDGIYISFENVVPVDEELKEFELKRWGEYQKQYGKTCSEVQEHLARCGQKYFPISVDRHIALLKETGFRKMNVFWRSYMQMGIYAIK